MKSVINCDEETFISNQPELGFYSWLFVLVHVLKDLKREIEFVNDGKKNKS